jgi:hypothetical protein
MFGLFKRSKIQKWEIELLQNTIMKLPNENSNLINQINDGLFRNVLLNASDIPDYISFGFNFDIYKKYCKEKEKDYKLTGIKVFDNKKTTPISYEIYVSSGVINGYSLHGDAKKYNIDVNKIDVSGYKKEFIGESDYNRIENILDADEKKIINPSKVYSVFIRNKEYFHIIDIEDGDFIGIDEKKVVYKITQDPMEVVILDKKIIDLLK